MYAVNHQTQTNTGTKEHTMPEKLDRCVSDVKGQGKSSDSAWAICTDSLNEEVAEAIGFTEHHSPLDIPFGREVPETVSIPSGASAISVGAKRKVGEVHVDNTHSGKKELTRMSENVLKQILETQLGECNCKNKSRRKV